MAPRRREVLERSGGHKIIFLPFFFPSPAIRERGRADKNFGPWLLEPALTFILLFLKILSPDHGRKILFGEPKRK